MNKAILIILIGTLLSCQVENPIEGYWSEVGNLEVQKSEIELYAVGETLFAKRTQLSDINKVSGWKQGDICWKNITKLNETTYNCIRIAKRVNEGITEVLEVESIIEVQNKDLISIKAFYSDNKLDDDGGIQFLKRIK